MKLVNKSTKDQSNVCLQMDISFRETNLVNSTCFCFHTAMSSFVSVIRMRDFQFQTQLMIGSQCVHDLASRTQTFARGFVQKFPPHYPSGWLYNWETKLFFLAWLDSNNQINVLHVRCAFYHICFQASSKTET